MNQRLSVGLKKVNYFDGMKVTLDTVSDEQSRHTGIDAATVANFMGSGVVEHAADPLVIFDTQSLNSTQQGMADGYSFDGQNVYVGSPLVSVSDAVKGVQLAVVMTGLELDGAEKSKVAIIGDSFDDSLIHDDLTFHENGTQITRGRYKSIRAILFNDFAGNLFGSRLPAVSDGYEFIGRCIIREAKALEVSTDTLMAYQNAQPDQFFSSFTPSAATTTLNGMLQDAIGADKSLSDLGIGFSSVSQRELVASDVTTRIGQKFQADGTNIQKISVLLSVKRDATALAGHEYDWSGQIVLSLHALQAQVACPVEPVPDNLEDFDPEPAVLSQLTLDRGMLEKQGVVLDGYAQKVDFVLTGSTISDPQNTTLAKDAHYVLTVGRSGNATTGTLLVEEATHTAPTGYMVVFDGESWTNVVESDMWYEIHGDYAKVSDGISYQDGVGTEVPRLDTDSEGDETTYVKGYIPLYSSSRSAANFVLVETTSDYSDPLQDPRTGNNVSSRVKPDPNISIVGSSSISGLVALSKTPVVLANMEDGNPRGNPSSISGESDLPGLVYGNKIDIIDPDADLRNHNLVGSILQPNIATSGTYRIIKQTLYADSYGDVNGDGSITTNDFQIVNSWLPGGYDLSNAADQQKIMDGYVSIEQVLRADVNGDGKVDATDAALIQAYIDGTISTFPAGGGFSRMRLEVEELTDPLASDADIPNDDSVFDTSPFSSVPFEIEYFATWIPDRISICDMRRLLPTTFTSAPSSTASDCDGGENDFFVPNDLMIGDGQILNADGTHHSVDFEVAHLTMIIPVTDSLGAPTFIDGYMGVNLFSTFVAESADGQTAEGFGAMKYADGTYVQISDFSLGKVKISAALQSHSNTYGSSPIDDIVGVNYDAATGLLTLWMKFLYDDGSGNIPAALSTKVLVTVFLKKAGFANQPQTITAGQVRTLFGV